MFNLNKNDLHKMQKRLIVGVLIIIIGSGIGFFFPVIPKAARPRQRWINKRMKKY